MNRRGFMQAAGVAVATMLCPPAFAKIDSRHGLIVAGKHPYTSVRCWLNGLEITNVCCASNEREGWAEVLPVLCRTKRNAPVYGHLIPRDAKDVVCDRPFIDRSLSTGSSFNKRFLLTVDLNGKKSLAVGMHTNVVRLYGNVRVETHSE